MKLSFLVVLISFCACTQQSTSSSEKSKIKTKSKDAQKTLTQDKTDPSTSEKTSSETKETLEPTTIDPLAASGNIDPKIKLAPSDILGDSNIVFPQLTLNITTADYLQVMRCAASYKMLTLQGQDMRTTPKLNMNDRKWGWSQAINDSHNCKIVSQYLIAPTYVDIPAPSGSFYYVANPCVSAAHSSTGQEGCSYNLSYTEPTLNYQNAYIDKLREKAIELATAQAGLYARLDEVRIIAKKFEIALHMCEEYYAFKETEKALQRGVIMLGLNVAGAALGGAFFGVQGAMMVGMLSQMMGAGVLNDMLNINPQMNTCLQGEASVSQTGATKEKDIERARINAQDFESKFNVKATLDRLSEILDPPSEARPSGGLIAQDLARMQKVMAEMSALDQKVLEVNTFIGSAKKAAEEKFSELSQ